ATGSKPSVPPFVAVDGRLLQTTDDALDAEVIPRSVAIIGGGVIGVEMASIYLNMGCEVTILELLDDILGTEDGEVRRIMRMLLESRGCHIHLGARAAEVKTGKEHVEIVFQDGAGT